MRRSRIASVAVGLGLGLVLALAGAAFAFWAVTVLSGSNNAEATAQTLPAGATPTVSVTPASNQTVTLSFAQASSSGGTALTAYNVKRYLVGSGTGASISGSCSIAASVVTCTDAPGSGSWQYTDVPAIASSSWVGAESAKSATAIVQALPTLASAAPSSMVVSTAITPSATLAGASSTPIAGGSIAFSVFGPQATAPSVCTGAGWTTVGSSVTVSGNASYNASTSFTPTAGGTYWWYASYGGDTFNAAANSGCSATSTVVHLAVTPATLPGATVYAAYSQSFAATGGTAPYSFAVTAGSLPSGLTLSSAGVLSGTDSAAGQAGTFSFTVTATDHVGLTGTVANTLVVSGPTISLASLSNPTGDATWGATATASAPGYAGAYVYAVSAGSLPTGLSLNSSTGGFTGTEAGPGTFGFTIRATDANGYSGSRAYSVSVASPTITVAPSSLPAATVYAAYSQTLTSSGGVSSYSYSESGTLPTGLTLSSAGVLSGTDSAAAQAGSYSFTVTTTDANSFTGTRSYTLVINAPTISLSALTNPTGEATYAQSATASGGQASYTYAITAGSLPTGLSLNTSTGAISGTSSGPGTFAFTITATDAHGYIGSQSYSLTPTAPTFVFAPTSLSAATVYTAYSQTMTVTGGVSTYTYAKTSGTLPTGLSLSSGGVLSGTISTSGQAGTYALTVTATDHDGFTGTKSYSLTVNPPAISISPTTLPSIVLGLGYSHQLTASATGYSGSYTYAVTAGTLPGGLSMSSSGLVTASTGLALGTYTFTVTATDANGYTGSQAYTVLAIL
jgi:hypothetical protein